MMRPPPPTLLRTLLQTEIEYGKFGNANRSLKGCYFVQKKAVTKPASAHFARDVATITYEVSADPKNMVTLQQKITDQFLEKLAVSKDVSALMIDRLRALLAQNEKPRAEDFVKIFAQPPDGDIK